MAIDSLPDCNWKDKDSIIARLEAMIKQLELERDMYKQSAIDCFVHLEAAVSLLEKGGKQAAPSDRMFNVMLNDYKNCIVRNRTILSKEKS